MKKIAMAQPIFNGSESAYVMECLHNTWISTGPFVQRFERLFARHLGIKHALTCCNGTAALHLALAALDIGPGDEVIVPTLTFVATANAVAYTGATPVFVDSEPTSWCIDPVSAALAITERTRAIIAVHLYGAPADMTALTDLCEAYGIALIEDCAEAIGTTWQGKAAGTLGTAGCFSFFANKTITTGEGGMITTHNAALAAKIQSLRGHAQAPDKRYWHTALGYNYRLTDLQAAIGCAQMESLEENLYVRRQIAAWYRQTLPELHFQDELPDSQHGHWMVAGLLPPEVDRDTLMARLDEAGIETRPVFYPLHTLPFYATGQSLPVAQEIARRGIVLPTHAALTPADVARVATTLGAALDEIAK